MANEKRLIDVNVPIRDLTAMKSMYDAIALDGIIKALKEAPTVDAVEAVRCKDCKHFVQSEPYDPCECMKWTIKLGVAYVNPDDFCSYGERKGE